MAPHEAEGGAATLCLPGWDQALNGPMEELGGSPLRANNGVASRVSTGCRILLCRPSPLKQMDAWAQEFKFKNKHMHRHTGIHMHTCKVHTCEPTHT